MALETVGLEAIEGQAEAVELLRRALESGRIAHAWAFIGPAGSGRKTTALAFARALVAPSGGAAAGRVDRGIHPDVHLLGPVPPASNPMPPSNTGRAPNRSTAKPAPNWQRPLAT